MWQANAWFKGGEAEAEGAPLPSASVPSLAAKERGNAHFRKGHLAQALEEYESAVSLDERNWAAWSNLALVLLSQAKHKGALAAADRALAENPRCAKALCLRGMALAELGEPHEALAALGGALRCGAVHKKLHAHAVVLRQKLELSLALHAPPAAAPPAAALPSPSRRRSSVSRGKLLAEERGASPALLRGRASPPPPPARQVFDAMISTRSESPASPPRQGSGSVGRRLLAMMGASELPLQTPPPLAKRKSLFEELADAHSHGAAAKTSPSRPTPNVFSAAEKMRRSASGAAAAAERESPPRRAASPRGWEAEVQEEVLRLRRADGKVRLDHKKAARMRNAGSLVMPSASQLDDVCRGGGAPLNARESSVLWLDFQRRMVLRGTASGKDEEGAAAGGVGSAGGSIVVSHRKQHEARSDAPKPYKKKWKEALPERLLKHLRKQIRLSTATVKDVFSKWDADGSGMIELHEFKGVLKELKVHLSEADYAFIFQHFDTDGSGSIEYKEFDDEVNADLKVGAAGEIAKDSRNLIELRSLADAEAAAKAAHLDDDTVDKFIASQVYKLCVVFKVDPQSTNQGVKQLSESVHGGERISLAQIQNAMTIFSQGKDEIKWSALSERLAALLIAAPVKEPAEVDFFDLSVQVPVDNPPSFYGKAHMVEEGEEEAETKSEQPAKSQHHTHHATRPKGSKLGEGCTIDDPSLRGISLAQLRALGAHVSRRCRKEGWTDARKVKLSASAVSMYDVCAYVIRPATLKRKCSYVELVAGSSQEPRFFVSHWWGQPLLQLIGALEQHASDRRLDLNTTMYWIGSLALNTYLEAEGYPDIAVFGFPRKTYITQAPAKAIKQASAMVVVLDAAATAFNRTWCCAEIALAYEAGKPVELYAPLDNPGLYDSKKYVGLCDGVTELDLLFSTDMAHALQAKVARECAFPASVLQRAYGLSLINTKTSDSIEKNQLLNQLIHADDELDDSFKAPPEKHPMYDKCTAMVRAAVATISVMRAVSEGHQTFHRMLYALDTADWTKRLNLHFDTRNEVEDSHQLAGGDLLRVLEFLDDHKAAGIFSNMPTNLEELVFRYPLTHLPSTFGKGKLRYLRHLDLRNSTNLIELPERLCLLGTLQTLLLSDCRALSELPSRLHELSSLETLLLQRCIKLYQLPDQLGRLNSLRVLDLEECIQLNELPDLVSTRRLFPKLEFLSLNKCESLKAVPRWVEDFESRGGALRKPV